MTTVRSPYDPELWEVLKTLPPEPPITHETILAERDDKAAAFHEELPKWPDIIYRDVEIAGPDGVLVLSVLESATSTASNRPAIYFIHGGCFVMGHRLDSIPTYFPLIKEHDVVVFTVEYRLAPEHPDPAPIDDCYAGLKWMSEHASELRVDPERILIAGFSAGGGLAAGISLLVRDRGGPKLCGQLLMCPMLDDRVTTVSGKQFMTEGTLTGQECIDSWNMLLLPYGRGVSSVSMYAAPSRATDLSRLPEAWVDVGSAEALRDECVEYASRLWEFGTQCELHVWPGAYHVFDLIVPGSKLAKTAVAMRMQWMKRVLKIRSWE